MAPRGYVPRNDGLLSLAQPAIRGVQSVPLLNAADVYDMSAVA
jgi:hypothetical protein